jgi:hypothetical protein
MIFKILIDFKKLMFLDQNSSNFFLVSIPTKKLHLLQRLMNKDNLFDFGKLS